jgi:phosphopantothenoylcysteine decarboxylase/phosphopantothenate--cysteine ligase
MHCLKDKKIILGVTGSIAAYKSAILVRLLVKIGAEIQVVMTAAAQDFITPLTLATLSKRPVLTTFSDKSTGEWNNHVDLGLWADAVVIAPATAHIISKCAVGNCDDLLTAIYLSARCPVFFAPAMDLDMYAHGSTKRNLRTLSEFGNNVVTPGFGELASGLTGDGRMAEPEAIVAELIRHFSRVPVASGKRVLITAGPTLEPMDPVRFISNRSSGKMGYAIASAFSNAGCDVTLISGPTNLLVKDLPIKLIRVESGKEMLEATTESFESADLVIYTAAVADYTPRNVSTHKIKKQGEEMSLDLVKTIDIAGTLAKQKMSHQLMIGFALETENELEYAIGKLERKNLDFIILNSLNDAGAGFAHDTNKITVIDRQKNIVEFPLKSKDEVAQDILSIVTRRWSEV